MVSLWTDVIIRNAGKGNGVMSTKKRENNILSRIQQTFTQHTRGAGQSSPSLASLLGGMGLGGAEKAPKGFRPISMTQAMIEFASPIMDYVENGTISDPNEALQLGMHLWNFTLPRAPVQRKTSQKDLIKSLAKTLHLTPHEAKEFFDRMIKRKAYLFPDEIQPEGTLTMFMRKDTEYTIVTFDERQLHLSDAAIPDTDDDRKLRDALQQMDQYLSERADYDVWESHFLSMQDQCRQCYGQWLDARGVPEAYSTAFAFCTDLFLTFLYQYDGSGLRNVSKSAWDEFFMDFVMRKAIVKPPEYTYWPPALRLLYVFLVEKGYLKNASPMRKQIDAIEPKFIALVKART